MSYDVTIGHVWVNHTSNTAPMWRKAGCDIAEYDGEKAYLFKDALQFAISQMVETPEFFKAMNPANGWGDYESTLEFLRVLLDACIVYPDEIVVVSR